MVAADVGLHQLPHFAIEVWFGFDVKPLSKLI
jgi:hypothetical protein